MMWFGRTAHLLVSHYGAVHGLRLLVQLRLLQLLPRDRIGRLRIPSLLKPIHLRARSSDLAVFKQALLHGNFAFRLTKEPRFIIDAGANIGLATVQFATRYPAARIVALEIDARNFALLKRNTKDYPNVTPMLAGLWSHRATLEVANPDAAEWSFHAREADVARSTRSVPGYGVDDLLREFSEARVDLLKVDIEGTERVVFGPESERWLDRVDTIAVELHDHYLQGCETAVAGRFAGRPYERSLVGEYHVFTRGPAAP